MKEELSNEEYENLKNLIKAGGDNYKIAKEIAAAEGIDIKEIIQEIIDELGFDIDEISKGFFEYAIWLEEENLIDSIIEIQGEDFDFTKILNVSNIASQSEVKIKNLISRFLLSLTPDVLYELSGSKDGENWDNEIGSSFAGKALGGASFHLNGNISLTDDAKTQIKNVLKQREFWLDGIYIGNDLKIHLY